MKPVFDVHIHFSFEIPLDKTIEIFKKEFKETGTVKGCFLPLPHHASSNSLNADYKETQNIKSLFLKRAFAPDFYAFGGLVHNLGCQDKKAAAKDFVKQVESYFSAGYDGMKMLEGYPSLLKVLGVPLNDELYDGYYDFMEQNGYPILIHIANPVENWDISSASDYAVKMGRVYDKSFPSKDEITAQTFGIMKKFPKLKLILAHCGFFSTEKVNAERFLGDYENTRLDITPGGEQLLNMAKDWDYWHAYFDKYQDRILYGTDFYAFPDEDQAEWRTCFTRRPNFVRQFFETDTEHVYVGEKFRGVKMDENILNKIYMENALKLMGKPNKIDENYMMSEAERLLALPDKQSAFADEDLKYIIKNLKG